MAEDKSSSMGNKVDYKSDQPCQLSYQIIKQITKDYDKGRIIGSGSFGIVYKGIYENEEEIAVKVLRNMIGIDNEEFQKEFENLRRLKHQNVVKLVGFCNEAEESFVEHKGKTIVADKMHTALCFEYVRNGSLSKHIHDVGCSGLNWHMLYKIIKGICQGLEYLRHGLDFSVWHLDLKPDNVLLDNNMIPKITDFGLSRLLGEENTRKTISFVGTGGYVPPEYIEHGLITKEFDIYSLGVIIAKLMAGTKDYFKIDSMSDAKFIKLVHDNWRRKLRETLPLGQLELYCEQVRVCIQTAVKCMKRNRQERPTIEVVVSNLIETEILIGNLGLQTEQFREGESIMPTRGIYWFEDTANQDETEVKADPEAVIPSVGLKELPLRLLKKITKDFSEERILSDGALGTLYKGILEDGEVIAVKKLAQDSPVPHNKSFVNEIRHITTLEHENAVKLVGFCRETDKKVVKTNGSYITADMVESLLCYEYLPKGSLEKNLFEVPSKMDWETRFQIIKGVCQGLHFLHGNQIVHMDIKPTNILLDNNMRPKIVDFGISRLLDQEETRLHTQTIAGSCGYMAPEHLYRGEVAPWCDVYSLGLLILETTTGQRIVINRKQPCGITYIKSVQSRWTLERIASAYPFVWVRPPADNRIAFRIVTKIPKKYRTKLPFCGIVLPKCTYTLNVITPEQKKAPPSESDESLTLQSTIALHEALDNVDPASVAVFLDSADDEVQEAKVVVPCEPLPETVSNQIIDGQNYRDVLSVDVHPTEPWILTSNQRGYICIWNYQMQQEEVESIEVTREPVYSAKFIEREAWFLVGTGDGYICVYNYNTMEEVVDPIEAHDSHSIMCLAVNPTHSYVLSASDDHTIKLWDWTNEWHCTRTFEGHEDTVTQVMFNPRNSESFASASLDHTVKVWNIHSATCNITWDGHSEGLLCVHYHPRYFQQFLISRSADGAAKVWDLETDSCVDTLQGHTESLSALCWHPDLRVLVTGSLDGTVQIWKSTSTTYKLENNIRLNLGAVNSLGYLKGLTRIVVGCDQGIALMEINVL